MQTHLQQARDDVSKELQQGLPGDPLDDFGLHLDGREVDGIVGCLDDGAEYFDALFWVDGTGQRGCGLLGSSYYLKYRFLQMSEHHTSFEEKDPVTIAA